MKGRVNLDKLTAFLEELRVSKSRTVSLGTLMCARDASAADNTHLVEVRYGSYAAHRLTSAGLCLVLNFEHSLWVIMDAHKDHSLHCAFAALFFPSAPVCILGICASHACLPCNAMQPFNMRYGMWVSGQQMQTRYDQSFSCFVAYTAAAVLHRLCGCGRLHDCIMCKSQYPKWRHMVCLSSDSFVGLGIHVHRQHASC